MALTRPRVPFPLLPTLIFQPIISSEVPSLFNLCKAVIISEEIPFSGRLGALEEMLEECNSETQGRLFRIFVLSEDDRSKYTSPQKTHPKTFSL